jgi:MFS family permease
VRAPMLPLEVFRSRQFSGANATTLAVYAALGGALFALTLQLQLALGYSPLKAGLALTPVTVLMLLLSPGSAKLADRIGYRWPMVVGSLLAGAGLALLSFARPGMPYLGLLPGVSVFGLGLAALVAPLTTAVLKSVDEERSGVASSVNNAVARLAGLLAIAVLPGVAKLHPGEGEGGYQPAMLLCAALCAAGALIAGATMKRQPKG